MVIFLVELSSLSSHLQKCGNPHVQKARKELARAEKARAEHAQINFFTN